MHSFLSKPLALCPVRINPRGTKRKAGSAEDNVNYSVPSRKQLKLSCVCDYHCRLLIAAQDAESAEALANIKELA
jgi:hypothetical protein